LKQVEKDILQIDDLLFPYQPGVLPMGIQSVAPRLGIARTEQNWTILWAIASFSRLLDELHAAQDGASMNEASSKKPRLLSRTKDILREASSSTGAARICALQLVPFTLSEGDPDVECLSSLLERLAVNILDESGLVASWTMVAIARLVIYSASVDIY
jgi:ataxia telangiectasia mutated family protein